MANFPIPYLYKNPAFWGDRRDSYYNTDFVNLPYQDKNIENEKEAVLIRMETYIKDIKAKELALMNAWGILNTNSETFLLKDASILTETNKKLQSALNQLKILNDETNEKELSQFTQTSLKNIQNINASTTLKTASKFILNNFLSNNAGNISIEDFLDQSLGPIQKVLAKNNPKTKTGKQWKDFLDSQAKMLSYTIDFFNSLPNNFKQTDWYINYRQLINELEEDLKSNGKKRTTKDVFDVESDITKFSISQDGQTITVNLKPLQNSVKKSLQSLLRQGFAGKVEKLLSQALSAELSGSKGFSGGIPFTFNILQPEIIYEEDDLEKEEFKQDMNSIKKHTELLLNNALKGRRTVKADLLWEDDNNETFGISIKSGQHNQTKLDTRSNYFTFINFISQYSPAIAEALLLPQNQHILVNIIANTGTFHSDSLDSILNMIAYAFFGAKSEDNINEKTQYFTEESKKYAENVIIINDEGVCTRISTYLTKIYEAIRADIQRQDMIYSLRTTFSGPKKESFQGPPPPHPHPAKSQLLEGANYLKNIAVETYIKTYH